MGIGLEVSDEEEEADGDEEPACTDDDLTALRQQVSSQYYYSLLQTQPSIVCRGVLQIDDAKLLCSGHAVAVAY
jgi:hypothetical protein